MLEILVEEPSAKMALDILLPKMLPSGMDFQVHNLGSKNQLFKALPMRLKGYAQMFKAGWDIHVLVLVDRDSDDCKKLKGKMEQAAKEAGFATKSSPVGGKWRVVNRVVIEELEAWFVGDSQAMWAAYPKISNSFHTTRTFKHSDAIKGGTWEQVERLLQKYGYHRGGLAKLKLAQEVASKMDPDRNISPSFQAFRQAVTAIYG